MKSILIDTNILMLFIVGAWNRGGIPSHRRTSKFTPRDLDLLREEIRKYERILTTAPVLAEASNLMGNQFHANIATVMVEQCKAMVEVTRPKDDVFTQIGFDRLGYADASILAATDDATTVLTDDVSLYNQLLYLGRDAINFNHLRKWE